MNLRVGVAMVTLRISGARTLKDRRQAVNSLRDRLRHRFDASVNEVDGAERPDRAVLAMTSAGNDGAVLRSLMDRMLAFCASAPAVVVVDSSVDVFPWP
jgi:uncharacterized protein YlxP (DUF503 family)